MPGDNARRAADTRKHKQFALCPTRPFVLNRPSARRNKTLSKVPFVRSQFLRNQRRFEKPKLRAATRRRTNPGRIIQSSSIATFVGIGFGKDRSSSCPVSAGAAKFFSS